jgi:hypothetical protein
VTRSGDLFVFLENYKGGQHFCATLFLSIDYVLSLTENGLGNILGNFFTSSSGHPASVRAVPISKHVTFGHSIRRFD